MRFNLNKNQILFLILAFGLGIRLFSVNYGLPYIIGPDESRQALDALSMGARKSLIPLDFTYPALHKYALLFLYSIYFMAGMVFKFFSGSGDFALKFVLNPLAIFFTGRMLSVMLGIAIAAPVYLTGKKFYGKNAGILACVFAVFMFQLSVHSQWATADIMVAFLSSYAFYYTLLCIRAKNIKPFLICGLLIGSAAGCKYQGLYLIPGFLLAVIFNIRGSRARGKVYFIAGLAALAAVSIFLLGNLDFIFNFDASFRRLLELKGEIMGISSLQPFRHDFLSVASWFVKDLIRQETLLGLGLIAGIIYSFFRHTKEDLVFIVYIAFCLFSLVPFGFRFLHLLVYSFPVICVFGARFIDDIVRYSLRKKYAFSYSLIASLIIVAPSVYNSIILDVKRSNPDTRELAASWIEQNIPSGSKIAQDWYDLCVPLNSEIPFLFRDDKLAAYYTRYLGPELRERYKEYISIDPVFDLVQVRYEAQEPVWPADMPDEAIARARKIPLVTRLYRWFNFRTLDELRRMGVSYLIISSYSYNHFLLDDDPRKKTGLFNPFMLEDTLASNRQAASYDKKSKYSLLFFLNKRARDFYLPLLDSRSADWRLIREFFPGKDNLGPVIRIYQFRGNQ